MKKCVSDEYSVSQDMVNDSATTLEACKKEVEQFIQERDWIQFHNAKSLSMNIAMEAAELMEKFVWCDNAESAKIVDQDRTAVEEELVDIFFALMTFANRYDIDIATAFFKKLEKNKLKYPIELARGRFEKYHVYTKYLIDKNKKSE